MNKISIIVPCYNEEQAIPLFYNEVTKETNKIDNACFEFLFIDDGSQDNTLNVLREYSKKDKKVRYISFSRNFGKESAMYAGLKEATGDYVAIMDADLQDPPSLLKEMYNTLLYEDYDCVATRRCTREGEPKIRSFFSRQFYKLINKISDTKIVDGARDFRMMSQRMVKSILELSESNRFSKGIFSWVGYKTKWLEYDNLQRVAGETKWSFWKLLSYSIDGIVAFSTAPLKIASIMGIGVFFVAVIFIVFIIIRTIAFGDPVAGWPSTICVILLISGLQLFCIGILGQYMSKTYIETKKRPIYIIKKTEKDDD